MSRTYGSTLRPVVVLFVLATVLTGLVDDLVNHSPGTNDGTGGLLCE